MNRTESLLKSCGGGRAQPVGLAPDVSRNRRAPSDRQAGSAGWRRRQRRGFLHR